MDNVSAISVIIPMYNSENYLGECLDSLLSQTFQDFEVIVINDCSTDNSRQIAETYLEKFSGRLKIFDNEKNFGAGASRNNGLRLSSGEYVFFLDADDKITPNAFKEMYDLANNYDVDVVNCTKFYRVNEGDKEFKMIDINEAIDKEIVEEDILFRMDNLLRNKIGWRVWLRLSRRDFLLENEIFFAEDIEYAEDQVWTHGLIFCAKKIVHIPRAYYFYRIHKDSIVWKKRDSLQIINVRLRVVINGLKWIEGIMGKVEFFQQNPKLRQKVLDRFTQRFFGSFFNRSLKLQQSEIYESIKQEFGKDFGDYDVLISTLLTLVNANQKRIEDLKKILENK